MGISIWQLLIILAIVLVVIFFVTSSDSGSLVIDTITAGGKVDAPVSQRIFWAVMEGLVAATLLIGGGLVALQTAAIATGLPRALIQPTSTESQPTPWRLTMRMSGQVSSRAASTFAVRSGESIEVEVIMR